MSGLNTRPIHRVKGRQALEQRLMRLLLATHRYAHARAATSADRQWCARMIDGLTHLLRPQGENR